MGELLEEWEGKAEDIDKTDKPDKTDKTDKTEQTEQQQQQQKSPSPSSCLSPSMAAASDDEHPLAWRDAASGRTENARRDGE